jgi:glycosyltransferase involved in cell wall biosynthesis
VIRRPDGKIQDASSCRQLSIAFVGNALPRRCGIATFTTDLEAAIRASPEIFETAIVAMRDPGGDYAYPGSVRFSIDQEDRVQYAQAASFINTEGFDVVCLQHEFGIFGGEAGNYLLDLMSALTVPLVTTLHTVLDQPSAAQLAVMDAILKSSACVVVMAEKARQILIEVYHAAPERIAVIPHGIPDAPFVTSEAAKERLGYSGRKVILTFGLISPNKGIETMIEAMPEITQKSPEAVYVVMGATHPHLLREAGETYRESLVDRVRVLGLEDHVIFLNRFVDLPELLEHITMCDVYVTPYLEVSQMTSGTLAYSHGLGRPVVSTPYWHAAELLDDGSGVLVPFGKPARLGQSVAALLDDEPGRLAMGKKAYAASRPMTWENTAERYISCFKSAARNEPRHRLKGMNTVTKMLPPFSLPETSTGHFTDMCDNTGLFQHAVFNIPDRNHGYCIDDNARALLLCSGPASGLPAPLANKLAARFAAFVQHAWNPDNGRFRNFMGFDRQWLEAAGSEDSHGRTLWALGTCSHTSPDPIRAQWAAGLFSEALRSAATFTSPRAWAFTLLGLDQFCSISPKSSAANDMRKLLAHRLEGLLRSTETSDWAWFEETLTYDNARLCEALIRTGGAIGSDSMVKAGLRSLHWLIAKQHAPEGYFRPVGSEGFMARPRSLPVAFDQQPIEACATIAACAAAYGVDPSILWYTEARRAFAWYLGENDLGLPLVDFATGSCLDGLHADRGNENRGAESVLSYLLGLADMRALELAACSEVSPSAQRVLGENLIKGPSPRRRAPSSAERIFATGSRDAQAARLTENMNGV